MIGLRTASAAGLAMVLAACGSGASGQTPRADGRLPSPETRAANTDYKPAFANQTRAPGMNSDVAFDIKVVASGLDHPWAINFLPDGRALVTEKPGRLRILGKDGKLSAPVAGVPAVDSAKQGALFDTIAGPDGLIYMAYAQGRPDGDGTAVARGRLVDGLQPRLEAVQTIFEEHPTLKSNMHFGGRLVFGRDGALFITLGERSILPGRVQAQKLDSDFGKIVRINPDGSIPSTNPFVGKSGARGEIWSIGHRNVQAATLDPSGQLWEVEHGPRGGDELNRVERGKDYGWPTITYGIEYAGPKVGAGITQHTGMEQPVYYWDPVIAPSGMAFYTGDLFPAWKGSLFIGSLKDKKLVRLTLEGGKVTGEEWLLTDYGQRIRDVRQGPDGALWLVTDEADGRVLRLVPKA